MTRRNPPTRSHHVEVAQVAQRGLDVGLLRLVGDEHEAGVVAQALLLRGADADAVAGEDPGDGVEDAGPVDDLEHAGGTRPSSRRWRGSGTRPNVPSEAWVPLRRFTAASMRSPSTALAVGMPPAPRP